MASQLSNQLVEAISQDNVLSAAEAFREVMSQICVGKLLDLREEAAKNLFRENVEPDLDSAIDFTLNRLEEKGPDCLGETIQIAVQNYNIQEEELVNFLKETFDPSEPYESLAEELVLGLCENSEQNAPTLVEYENNTARVVLPEEAKAVLNLWESLNVENRRLMEETLCESVDGFNKVLAFAECYLEEIQNA